jgi:type IV pilus assembly protein PilV
MTSMPRTPCLRQSPAQRGFTLIEILVAVVIIAVSVLGLGGLLAKVHTNAHSALLRTDATIVMTDMAERLMANRANVITTPADYTTSGTVDCSTQPTTTVPVRDLWQFRCMAKLWLPSGTGTVSFDSSTAPTIATVTVSWDDSRGTNGSSSQTLSQTVNLK